MFSCKSACWEVPFYLKNMIDYIPEQRCISLSKLNEKCLIITFCWQQLTFVKSSVNKMYLQKYYLY